MAVLQVINDLGEVEEREVVGQDVQLDPEDQERFSPAVTQRVEYDHEGMMSQITTVCGETENRREGDSQADITVEGVVTEDGLDPLKRLEKGDNITFTSDIDSGEVIVHRVTIEQTNDLVSVIIGGEESLGFSFQLQLKYPE